MPGGFALTLRRRAATRRVPRSPPALSVFVLARQYDAWVQPASGAVILGTVISVVSLTTVMWLVQIR